MPWQYNTPVAISAGRVLPNDAQYKFSCFVPYREIVLSLEVLVYGNYREWSYLGPETESFVERSNIQWPFLGASFIVTIDIAIMLLLFYYWFVQCTKQTRLVYNT